MAFCGEAAHGLLQNGESWLGRQNGAQQLKDTAPLFHFLGLYQVKGRPL
jgi:hypothetical protein